MINEMLKQVQEKFKKNIEMELNKFQEIQEITLFMTQVCNLNCSYCTQKHINKNIFELEKVKLVLEQVLNKTSNDFSLHFFGGEPTIEFNNIKKIISYLIKLFRNSKEFKRTLKDNQRRIFFVIYSNGIFRKKIIDDVVKINIRLKKLEKFGIFSSLTFNISFDGLYQIKRDPTQIHLDKIKENIFYMKEKEKDFNFRLLNGITFIYDPEIALEDPSKSLLKNYLYLSDLFKIPETFFTHSLLREPYTWNEEKINKYQKDFQELILYHYKLEMYNKFRKQMDSNYQSRETFKYINRLFYSFDKANSGKEIGKYSCGAGVTRLSIYPNGEIKDCGVIDFNEDLPLINKDIENDGSLIQKYLNIFCSDCEPEYKKYCNKKCLTYIIKTPQEFKNTICKIKKLEIEISRRYYKKIKGPE